MATIAEPVAMPEQRPDALSGTERAHALDRWIYVIMAAWFIVIVLTGFIPDSLMKIEAVRTGARPPFPLILHIHAVLMGSFLLLLLAQTWLVATGKRDGHRSLGRVGLVLAPALVLAGFALATTNYHGIWDASQNGPVEARGAMTALSLHLDNILLLQLRIGVLFSLFIWLGLRARGKDDGMHKRMMILATAIALPAAIDRMDWLPTTLPASPLTTDLYVLLAIAPMFVWDVLRNRNVHRAYWSWGAVYLVASVAVNMAWDTVGWHAMARTIMMV